MKKLYILPALLLLSSLSYAQTLEDIVRYSMTTNTGTARSSAMGGAFGALGGDLSTFSTNPAGIGVFRNSEISVTPYLNVANNKSSQRPIRNTSFQLGSIGGVVALYNSHSDWKGFNFGFNYTNLNNFNQKINRFVYDSPTSFTQVWANEANLALSRHEQIPPQSEMAYNVGLIDWLDPALKEQYEPTLLPGEEINQHQYIKEEGYEGQYDFSFGTNYMDKLYLGLSIGIQTIRYKYRSQFTGKGDNDNYFGLDTYYYNYYLKTEGAGTNFKVGVIYRPIAELRIGAAIHTPTFYSMTDDYEESIRSYFYQSDRPYDSYIQPTHYNYDMQTPWKALFSVATVIMQKGIISVDYEFDNYQSAKFSNGEQGYDFYKADGSGANDQIKAYLKNTHNFRIGAEYRANSVLSLRGGYSFWASPYKHTTSAQIQSVSGGFGLKFGNFFLDAAYVYKFAENNTRFYEYIDPDYPEYNVLANAVNNKYNTHQGKITFGIKF